MRLGFICHSEIPAGTWTCHQDTFVLWLPGTEQLFLYSVPLQRLRKKLEAPSTSENEFGGV